MELFGNMMYPKETEFLQSLTLVAGSENFMLYLFSRHGPLNPTVFFLLLCFKLTLNR